MTWEKKILYYSSITHVYLVYLPEDVIGQSVTKRGCVQKRVLCFSKPGNPKVFLIYKASVNNWLIIDKASNYSLDKSNYGLFVVELVMDSGIHPPPTSPPLPPDPGL